MDARRTAADRHIEPIVDNDAGAGTASEHNHDTDQRSELTGGQVSFANLDHVDARLDRIADLAEEAP
jgi:hypothetical protein